MERFGWRITAPGTPAVDLPAAKNHLRVEHTVDDALITMEVAAAQRYCEGRSGHVFTTSSGSLLLDRWPPDCEIRVPYWPVSSVTSVKYKAASDPATPVEVPTADWYSALGGRPARILPAPGKSWPGVEVVAEGIEVEMEMGYGATMADVPEHYREAILALTATMYEQRSSTITGTVVAEVDAVLSRLLSQDRIYAY